MDSLAAFATLAILWTVTLCRAPAALKHPAKHSLWPAFAANAVAMTAELPQIGPRLDAALHVTNASILITYIAGMLATASVVEWVIGKTRPTRRLGQMLAWRHLMTGAAVATLGSLFAFIPRIESSDFIDTAPGHPATTAFEAVWFSYLGLAALCTTAMFAVAWQRCAGKGLSMRASFAMLAIGTGSSLLYATWCLGVLVACLVHAVSPSQSDTALGVSGILQAVAVGFILLGSCLPAVMKAVTLYQDRRDLMALHALWQLVTPFRQDTGLHPEQESGGNGELREFELLCFRLIRRTMEIRDALGNLYEYCDLHPAPYVEAFAENIGLTGIDRDALVEAATIHYAMLRAGTGSGGHSIVEPRRGEEELPSEIRWWRAVDHALNNHLRIQAALIPVLAARDKGTA